MENWWDFDHHIYILIWPTGYISIFRLEYDQFFTSWNLYKQLSYQYGKNYAELIRTNSIKSFEQALISTFDPHLINNCWSEVNNCILIKNESFRSPSFAWITLDLINPVTIQLNTYEVIINLIELFFPDPNLVLQATFSKAGAELGTAQPQLVLGFYRILLWFTDDLLFL